MTLLPLVLAVTTNILIYNVIVSSYFQRRETEASRDFIIMICYFGESFEKLGKQGITEMKIEGREIQQNQRKP